ncbi:hypothetical protein O181_041211 [Austropuccinia psidii MF-1]|uniref:Uncharacterized protein n=1 Tax=Austropuccinia psidii MF-1 TaxID=1389203 RepID=A0A9Q3DCP5_9BASI|nr:hypothetical protein [Austropuccinia psidii MF-1]
MDAATQNRQKISPVPSSIDLSTHYPMVTSLLDWSKVVIRPMKDGNGKRTFEVGLIITHGIKTPKTKPSKSPATRLLRSFELALPPSVEPSQYNETPISGTSQSSKSQVQSHEDTMTHEPEPEMALMQSTEDPFDKFLISFFSCSKNSITPPSNISILYGYPLICNNH